MKQIDINAFANAALNAGYSRTAAPPLKKIGEISRGARMQSALRELDTEAERLAEKGEPITADNAHLLKVLAEIAAIFAAANLLIRANAGGIEASGQKIAIPAVTAKVFAQVAGTLPVNPASGGAIPMLTRKLKPAPYDCKISAFFGAG